MSDQSPSDGIGTGPECLSPPFESEEDFDKAYDEFIHNDTSLPTTEPATPGQDHALHAAEILDLNQLAQKIMETTQATSQAPITTVSETGTQRTPMTCSSEQSSTLNPSILTQEQLLAFFDLPPISLSSNLLDTSLTTSQLVAELNTVTEPQSIVTQDLSEIEAPVVRNQPVSDSNGMSPYSFDSNTANSPSNLMLSHMASHLVNSPSPQSTDPVTSPGDTPQQDICVRSQGPMWMLQTPLPPLPSQRRYHQSDNDIRLVTLSFFRYLSEAVEWLCAYNPPALYAHYAHVKAYVLPYSQPTPQSKAAPSGTTHPVVLGKRVRGDPAPGEDMGSSAVANLSEPQSEEPKPIKKRKTSSTTTKKVTGSDQTPTTPTKHRNSFILYRCLLSKIKKWIQDQDPGVGSSSPLKKQSAEHQCVFSRRAGIVYKTRCNGADEGPPCRSCANCHMRGLFERAAAQLKQDVHGLEIQLRTTPDPLQAVFVPNRQRITSAIDWVVFARTYYQSDLFRRHPELYVEGQMLTVEQIKDIWIESEVEKQQQKFDAVKREFQ
ncbi:hypothetical protein BG003_004758 [Podila horticola]|nr:hypothetical protein BG003_004758 [Podila horticola]